MYCLCMWKVLKYHFNVPGSFVRANQNYSDSQQFGHKMSNGRLLLYCSKFPWSKYFVIFINYSWTMKSLSLQYLSCACDGSLQVF